MTDIKQVSFAIASLGVLPVLAVLAVGILLVVWLLVVSEREIRAKEREILDGVYGGRFLTAAEFEENWIVAGGRGRSGAAGYKYEDGPGCYVILMFDHEVRDGDWGSFGDVYIGQSVHMCARVHAHFNGKGNGDVYADLRSGRHVYVQLKPCGKEQMNELEKSLIAAFHATDSYNRTRGGGAQR